MKRYSVVPQDRFLEPSEFVDEYGDYCLYADHLAAVEKAREDMAEALACNVERLYSFGGQDVEAVPWDAIEEYLKNPTSPTEE